LILNLSWCPVWSSYFTQVILNMQRSSINESV
jgi:hypothetical protein